MADPLPIEILKKKGADILIVVNVDDFKEMPAIEAVVKQEDNNGKFPNILKILQKSFAIMFHETCEYELLKNKADVLIEPKFYGIRTMDFNKSRKIIRKGERAAEKSLKKLKDWLSLIPLRNLLKMLVRR